MIKNIKSGKASGWKSMSDKRESFPEKFWKRVLNNNNITYQFQLKVTHRSLGMTSGACYFLDFALPGKVDLEIDGQQHKFRQEEDKKRTENLEKNGWTVYRVDWNDIQSHNGKMEMKSKIERFLQWYKDFCDVHLC